MKVLRVRVSLLLYPSWQKREVTLAIRLYSDGALSRLFRQLKVGDEVDISGPFDGQSVSQSVS